MKQITKHDIEVIRQGIQSEFWQLLCRFLDNDILSLSQRINEEDDIRRTEDDRRPMIELRRATIAMRNYPDILVGKPKTGTGATKVAGINSDISGIPEEQK